MGIVITLSGSGPKFPVDPDAWINANAETARSRVRLWMRRERLDHAEAAKQLGITHYEFRVWFATEEQRPYSCMNAKLSLVIAGFDPHEVVAADTAAPKPTDIRALRKRHHLSQQQLADLVGVLPATVAKWEAGGPIKTVFRYWLQLLINDPKSNNEETP